MALINCPECNHQISDKALSCPQCGFPLHLTQQHNATLSNTQKLIARLIFKKLENTDKIKAIKELRSLLDIGLQETVDIVNTPYSVIIQDVTLETAKAMREELDKIGVITEIEEYASEQVLDSPKEQSIRKRLEERMDLRDGKIRCPHCGSLSITTGQRGFSILTGFLGSNKTVNRCGSCGHTWKPNNIILTGYYL